MENQQTLTQKQEQTLAFIKHFAKENGYPPTVREICRATGCSSTSTVQARLNLLEKKGYIKRTPIAQRSIEVLDKEHLTSIPIYSKINTHEPFLSEENLINFMSINTDFLPDNKNIFLLKVSADCALIHKNILPGDAVLIAKQSAATNGDLIAVLVNGSLAITTYNNGVIFLQTDTGSNEPLKVEEVQIIGKVIGTYRQFD
jgi:repressor LexA